MKEDKRVKQIQKLLDVAEGNLASARHLLLDITGEQKTGKTDHKESAKDLSILNDGKVIEGIFDGEQMVAPDGKKYPVPANYASKSKLVEGDTLKLTISEDGGLIYKQIKPVERRNLVGALSYDGTNYSVMADGKSYKVLFASVTYYKGEPGSQVSIIIPASGNNEWAAVESVIHDHKKNQNETKPEETKEPPKTFELPEENKEILKEVKESFDKSSQNANESEKETETPKIPSAQTDRRESLTQTDTQNKDSNQPKFSDDMTVQEASKASFDKETNSPEKSDTAPTGTTISQQDVPTHNPSNTPKEEHPDIHHQDSAYLEEASPFANEEKEPNSLGEEIPAPTSQNQVRELEI